MNAIMATIVRSDFKFVKIVILNRFIKIKFSNKDVNIVCLATAIAIIIASFFLSSTFTNNDDWEHLHASWLVWSGKVPYKDFYEHHHPLLWYILAPIMGLFYEKASVIYAARIIMVILSSITWFFIYKICARFLKDARIWFFTIILLFTSRQFTWIEYMEIRPETPMYMFFWSGLYNYFAYLQKQKLRNLTWAFVLFTLSIICLQKILPLLFILGLSGLYYWKKGKIRSNDIILALPYPMAILAVFFLYLYYNGCLEQYYILNYSLNYLLQIYYGLKKYDFLGFSFTLNNGYAGVNFETYTIIFCTLVLLLLIIKPFGKTIYRQILLLIFISELLLRWLTFSPWHQYFILLNTLSLMLLSCYISEWLKSYSDLIIILVYTIMFPLNYNFVTDQMKQTNLSDEIALRQYIIDNSTKDDIVFNCGQFDTINIYRYDSDYVWFGFNDVGWIYHRKFDKTKFDLNEHILLYKPKFVCTKEPILIPYAMRLNSLYVFNNDLYRLKDFEVGDYINLDIPTPYAYQFDNEILSTYYEPTPFNDLVILKDSRPNLNK